MHINKGKEYNNIDKKSKKRLEILLNLLYT